MHLLHLLDSESVMKFIVTSLHSFSDCDNTCISLYE